MAAQWLSTIGLGFGMLGVVLIFFWGPPQPIFEDVYGPSSGPSPATEREKRRHKIISRLRRAAIVPRPYAGVGHVRPRCGNCPTCFQSSF